MRKIEKLHPPLWENELENWLDELKNLKRQLDSTKMITEKRARANGNEIKNEKQRLRISTKRTTCYYLVTDNKKTNGKYIPKSQMKVIKKIAQDNYDEKVYKRLVKEIKLVEEFLANYKNTKTANVYLRMKIERQKLITPLTLQDEDFIEKWQSEEYHHKSFVTGAPEHYTGKNERVRSKSEVIIADTLAQAGIPYKYEKPVLLGDIYVHPDFCCLNIHTREEIFWEHFGMMDDSTYSQNACQKLHAYQEHGYYLGQNLIITWETSEIPFNKEDARLIVEKYL